MLESRLPIVLKYLQDGLAKLLGDQLEAAYLYGSQARGTARPDSDIDVVVVLRGEWDYFEMIEKTGALVTDLSLENETVITLAFISREDFQKHNTPFLMNVRREGIIL